MSHSFFCIVCSFFSSGPFRLSCSAEKRIVSSLFGIACRFPSTSKFSSYIVCRKLSFPSIFLYCMQICCSSHPRSGYRAENGYRRPDLVHRRDVSIQYLCSLGTLDKRYVFVAFICFTQSTMCHYFYLGL